MYSFAGFSTLDFVSVFLFFFLWISHYHVINNSRYSQYAISSVMARLREDWMRNVVRRVDTPIDAIIQTGLQQGVLFFCSTSVLLIGALAAGLGASDRAVAVLQEIPMSTTDSNFQWEVKILLVVFIFVYAFFKFAWSFRLYNYLIIMIGAVPTDKEDTEALDRYAVKMGRLHSRAARHFTTGLNSYFFALAAFTWFINAWFFIGATVWINLVLYRRAFKSEFLKVYQG